MRRTGADYKNGHCEFVVWAPEKSSMVLHLVWPEERKVTMTADGTGYFSVGLDHVHAGYKYYYRPDDEMDYPDPASFYQPDGVHGPSMVIDHASFPWKKMEKSGVPLDEYIIYEIHVGTFTPEGTFAAIIPRLSSLKEIGITAIEIMPVGQFPGERNWGYDGVYPYAVQHSYGGPEGLKELVDACHALSIAVILDVIYNHFGPEGNYFEKFGPYFTDTYKVPWGKAINFDGRWSDGVRDYVCSNMIYWTEHFHLDGLRLDAIHTIYDFGAVHLWEYVNKHITTAKQKFGPFYLFAENDVNSVKAVKHPEAGGYGFDAQWLDDFHHSLYVLLDQKGLPLYSDFGKPEQFAKALTDGFVHSGEYVTFRKKKHGSSSAGVDGNKFIVFNQNHDQIGNRGDGARLSQLISFDLLKVASAALLLSPYIPLLYMGEEYGDTTPFYFFVSHSEQNLIKQVNRSRKEDFERLMWKGKMPPQPQSDQAFYDSKINWDNRNTGKFNIMLQWNSALLNLRKKISPLKNYLKNDIRVQLTDENVFAMYRTDITHKEHLFILLNLSARMGSVNLPRVACSWMQLLDSGDQHWSESSSGDEKKVIDPTCFVSGSAVTIKGFSARILHGVS